MTKAIDYKRAYFSLNREYRKLLERVVDHADHRAVMSWIFDHKRKSAILSFTEGPERQIAYAVEWLLNTLSNKDENTVCIQPPFLLRPSEQCRKCGSKFLIYREEDLHNENE